MLHALPSITQHILCEETDLAQLKQKPLIYTGANFYDNYLLGKLDSYKLMIAQYTKRIPVLRDGRDFEMWQYTGKGRLNGINGYVDKSRFMGRHKLREIRFRHR